ncbi:MAG: sn-glycerol-1-phosphate dehydrogenase [Clostridia bacterium]|jgi:glycerol-1-phosphate dehydrogenase [NAD(P)+]
MTKLEFESLDDLTNMEMECICGEVHRVGIRRILIEEKALYQVFSIIRDLDLLGKALLVADRNTYAAAGRELEEELIRHGLEIKSCILLDDGQELHADEKALGSVLVHLEEDTRLLIAVGSGTLNDIVRYMSYRMGIPYIVVATAPSMDGYASTVSPLVVNGFKKTFSATYPVAIVGDVDILRQAPMETIQAGLGDVLGKMTSLSDWLLGYRVNGEYYCPLIVGTMQRAAEKCIQNVEGLSRREGRAIKELMEGLILAGITMQMAGNSRPASGSEHHLSHYWEMQHLMEKRRTPLHGIKVGVATLLIHKMYDRILKMEAHRLHAAEKTPEDIEEWKRDIKRCFGPLADEVFRQKEATHIPHGELEEKIRRLATVWPQVKEEIKELLSLVANVRELLQKIGAPSTPAELGVSLDRLYDALRYAKEVRDRYTVLQLADQLGVLDSIAKEIVNE